MKNIFYILMENHVIINFLFYLFYSPLYDMLRKNLVALATAATGMSHHISSVFITTLTLRGQIMEKQGGFRWKLNAVLPWLVGDGCHTKCCYYLFDFSLWKFSSILTLRKIEITSYQLKIASLGDLPSGRIVIQVVYFLCKSRATFVLFIE